MNSTNSTESSAEKNLEWSIGKILILVLCSSITIMTILGNGLVLLSVKFRLRARSYSDYFIVSLCLADFFVGLFVMPLMTMYTLHSEWPFNYRLCYIWMSIDFTCSTASFLTLASMALDRYWALTAPYFHLRNRSYTSVLLFIISSWLIPFAIWPSSVLVGSFINRIDPSCVHPAPPLVIVILCIFFYYIPLLFMLACYSRIIVNIKNIEVLIRGTWDSINITASGHDMKTSILSTKSLSEKSTHTTSSSLSSVRLLLSKYFQRSRTKTNSNKLVDQAVIIHEIAITQPNSNEYRHIITKTRRSTNPERQSQSLNVKLTSNIQQQQQRQSRPTKQRTTATFIGQKRCINELNQLSIQLEEEEQQLVRARLNSRTSSLPSARCIAYYYCQQQIPSKTVTTKALIQDQQQEHNESTKRSLTPERSRSQSHSSAQCLGNVGPLTTDTDHSSSFENPLDNNQRCVNRCTQPSRLSTSYNSNRYSQRAIAQFMHERNKARLRRNQKASRMLGILLAVFLICWLPFIISYPSTIFYPEKFPGSLQIIIFWFGYVNSLLNPFLYVYSSRNFRQAIIETLCCYIRIRSQKHLRYQWSVRTRHN